MSMPATALLAVAVVIVVAQLVGALAERLGQPRVIGEIVGGILLGPSLLGVLAPGVESTLFAAPVRGQLHLLGQLGLVLFMFLVGVELNPRLLQGRLPLATRITTVGVLLPLTLGVLLAKRLERWQPSLIPGEGRLDTALFLGTAMAITAFPVLARILRERHLLRRPLGPRPSARRPSTTWWAGHCWRRWWPAAAGFAAGGAATATDPWARCCRPSSSAEP
jgi:Kef-type K+ transport system membrane component KefB